MKLHEMIIHERDDSKPIAGLKGYRWHPNHNPVIDPESQIYYYLLAHPDGKTYMEMLRDIDKEVQRQQSLENQEDRYFGTKFKMDRPKTNRLMAALKSLIKREVVKPSFDYQFRYQEPVYFLSKNEL